MEVSFPAAVITLVGLIFFGDRLGTESPGHLRPLFCEGEIVIVGTIEMFQNETIGMDGILRQLVFDLIEHVDFRFESLQRVEDQFYIALAQVD